MAQMVKNPPKMWDTWLQPLGWEDSLKEGMKTHSSILAWRIPMDRGAWQAPWGHEESDMTEQLNTAWASSVSQLVKNPPASAGHARDTGLIPVLERSPEERNGNPL